MRQRLLILTEIIAPYRIPLFNALARAGLDLHVIFLAETDPTLRQWRVYKEEIRFSYQVLPSWRKRVGRYNLLLNSGLWRTLNAFDPDAILCGGYNYVASWQGLLWARAHGVPFLLWSESNLLDQRRGYALVEILKGEFLRQCSGFAVAGQSGREYFRAHGIRDGLIFTTPNAVDNDLFAMAAAASRQNANAFRAELGLPSRYILFVGRLVREKGVFDLLSAYAKLDRRTREQVALFYVGGGGARQRLEKQAATVSPGMIRFADFVQRDQLATYYALAEMMILPTHSDTWGLVVNEGMACGLPIILSRVAGCAADLVRQDWNGMLVSPENVPELAAAIERLVNQPELRARMAANSLQHISHYSPETWSQGVMRAIDSTGGRA